jgi:hypothetical protein
MPVGSSTKKPPLPLNGSNSQNIILTDNYLNFNDRVRHLENNTMGSEAESESKMKIRITSDSPRAARNRLNLSRQNSDRVSKNQDESEIH